LTTAGTANMPRSKSLWDGEKPSQHFSSLFAVLAVFAVVKRFFWNVFL